MSVNRRIQTLDRTGGRGFTLLEILIVGAIISLFAGLAIIGAQQMYDSNKRKGIYDETKTFGTGLSFAQHDLGFFPRLYLLRYPLDLVAYTMNQTKVIRPGFDAYGLSPVLQPLGPLGPNLSATVASSWKGPYMGANTGRTGLAQGQQGMVKMRLPDGEFQGFRPQGETDDLSLVDWPADPYGNPYMFYAVTTDQSYVAQGSNPKGLRLINRANESANYFVAVVSYGMNEVPGGNDKTKQSDLNQLAQAALYVAGDAATGNNGPGIFTLKSYSATSSNLRLDPTDKTQMALIARSVENFQNTSKDPALAGICDSGSDDIYWTF